MAAGVAVVVAVGGRTGWDAGLLDRTLLGVSARSVSSTKVRLHFADGKYFSEWTSLNRSARH